MKKLISLTDMYGNFGALTGRNLSNCSKDLGGKGNMYKIMSSVLPASHSHQKYFCEKILKMLTGNSIEKLAI